MKNTDKVTLTFGQLKRLVKESMDDPKNVWYWSINELRDDAGHGWESYRQEEGSDYTFDNADDAYADGLRHFNSKRYPEGHWELEIWNEDGDIEINAELHDGKLTEY